MLGLSVPSLFINHADVAIAHAFWFGAVDSFKGFVEFVDTIMAPDDFMTVVNVCGR